MHSWDSRTIMYAYYLYNNLSSARTSLLSHHIHLYAHLVLRIVYLVCIISKKPHLTQNISTGSHIDDPDDMPRGGHEAEPDRDEAYSIKNPPFWPSVPQVWFIQVEAQFAARGITAQQTKYHHIVVSLSPELATKIRDLYCIRQRTVHMTSSRKS